MDSNELPAPPPPRRRWLAPMGFLAAGLLAGGIVAGAQLAGAQDATPSPSMTMSTHGAPMGDPASMRHGPGETLLTGDTASQVEAAALEAVPGATVIRVETDANGDAYEAHLQKQDGTYVTVKLDKGLNVTSTQDGFGAGGGPWQAPSAN